METDKQLELNRYDERAKALLARTVPLAADEATGALAIVPIYRAPYVYFESTINRLTRAEHDVLELGAGTGLHTAVLAHTGAHVMATDISKHSLEILERRIGGNVTTTVADIEALPFGENSFDVVTCAGSLSYGAAEKVDREIRRVLKPGGSFIGVDSLNDNPIYRLHRWVDYLRGRRSKSTLLNMPTCKRIDSMGEHFEHFSVRYFGAVSFLMPLFAAVIGQSAAARVSDAADRLIAPRLSAFKAVVIARGRL
jgi:ubiquinone/menaquinone biosynthesis C-methylase UbiE